MGDTWSMYGVRKGSYSDKAGVEDLRTTKTYECGVCGIEFGREIYDNIVDFYNRHYVKCGVPRW